MTFKYQWYFECLMRKRLTRPELVERNRERVLAAAREVLLARGYAGATLDAIAEEAGFSKGVMYSQFGSKADLFLALLERRIAERAAENERVVERASGPEGVVELLRTAKQDATTQSSWAELLIEFRVHAARDPELSRRYAEAHARTIAGIASALAQMLERTNEDPALPARTMAQLVLALGSGIVLERIADPEALPIEEIAPALLRAFGFKDAGSATPAKPAPEPLRSAAARKP